MLTLATTLPMPAGYFMPVFIYGEFGGSCPTPGGTWPWSASGPGVGMGCIQCIRGGEEIRRVGIWYTEGTGMHPALEVHMILGGLQGGIRLILMCGG